MFDSKGPLTGTIALACPVQQTTAADLPLTLAIAREVGNLLLTDSLLAETNRHLNQLNALLESMDDGVISWDDRVICNLLMPRRRGSCALTRRQVRDGQSLNS
ncbi:hypothetical protein ACLB1N_06850 [Escherichia coli]